jgi:AraC-like DNA-binding protein
MGMTLATSVHEFRGDGRQGASCLFSRTDHLRLADDAGLVRTEIVSLDGGSLRFGRVRSTGHEIELQEHEHATFIMPLSGALDVEIVGRAYAAGEGGMLALRPNRRKTVVRPPVGGAYSALIVLAPFADLARRTRDAGSGFRLERDGAQTQKPQALRLSDYLTPLLDGLFVAPFAGAPPDIRARRIAAIVDDLLGEIVSCHDTPVTAASVRRVRAAIEIMEARADEDFRMEALAAEVGVGLRSLQLAFRRVYGIEPRAMLARIRLERARKRLLNAAPDEQVTSVALESGFSHLSRFAQAYRRAYGESPSQTLRRIHGRAARDVHPPSTAACGIS